MTYDDVRDRIGDALGYGLSKSAWSGDSNRVERVERILEMGLGRFYNPPVLPGERERWQWSFLTPTVNLQLETGVSTYDLPQNFVMFEGALTHAPGVTILYPKIRETGAERVRYELQNSGATGRPFMYGVRVKNNSGVGGTQWEMVVYPIPDEDYQVQGAMRINPVVPGADGDLPLGGQPHDQTVIEACLAEWELFDEYAGQAHQIRFMECLISSVSHDRNVSSPKAVGYFGDPGAYGPVGYRDNHGWDEHRTFYNGIET